MSTARYSSSASGAGLLVLEDVTVGYPGGPPVLQNVSLDIQPGEVAGLTSLDASGGCSTLVRVAAGLLPPWSGRVLFDGEDVYAMGFTQDQAFRARLAAVLEGGALLVNQTVRDNVALPLRYHLGLSGQDLRKQVDRLLAQAGFNEDPELFSWQVSARGRRLAAFARALARQPKLILVDRFFEGLEMPDWKRLFELVLELNHQDGVAWLLISELDPAIFQVAERVAILDEGELLDYGHRKRLYRDARIKAAFEAAEDAAKETQEARSAASESRPSDDPAATHDSERILIVESNEELAEVLGTDSAEATIAAFGLDPAGTIALDGKLEGEPGARKVPVGYGLVTPPPIDGVGEGPVDPEQTMTLDGPPRLERPKLVPPPPRAAPPLPPAQVPAPVRGEETLTISPEDLAAARAALKDEGDAPDGTWVSRKPTAAPPPPARPPRATTRAPRAPPPRPAKPASKPPRPPAQPVKLSQPGPPSTPPPPKGRSKSAAEETLTIDGQILDEVRRRIVAEAKGERPASDEGE